MQSQKQGFEFLSKHQFTYKQFCSVVDRNENTIRTWISKYLPNIGSHKGNSSWMLYSGLDCVKTVIFSELLDLSLSREASKVICLSAQGRVRELALLSEGSIFAAQKNPKFMVIARAGETTVSGHRAISAFSLAQMVEAVDTPSVLLPVDAIFWRVTASLKKMTT